MIQLLKGEADTLYALRELGKEWISARMLSLRIYPDKPYQEYYQRARTRLDFLESVGFAESYVPGKNKAKLYRVTSSGIFDPFDVKVNQHCNAKAAVLMRRESLNAYHATKRAALSRHATEQALDAWLEQKPARIIVPAQAAPRVSAAALRGASVFAWAGQ